MLRVKRVNTQAKDVTLIWWDQWTNLVQLKSHDILLRGKWRFAVTEKKKRKNEKRSTICQDEHEGAKIKTRVIKSWLVSVLHLIGWERETQVFGPITEWWKLELSSTAFRRSKDTKSLKLNWALLLI